MEYKEYTTVQNDRWDLISQKFYGSPFEFDRIMQANPDVPKSPLLAAGIDLRIPIVYVTVSNAGSLPPWKR